MATNKSFTDISQSRKLAEILPLESADMYYSHEFVNSAGDYYKLNIVSDGYFDDDEELGSDIPCWSLVALLGVLPRIEHLKPFIDLGPKLDSDEVAIYYHSEDSPYIVRDNPIDACVAMIEKLNELKML